jgi:U32 family peptidase
MNKSKIEKTPELLAPAGDWDCLKAAVANGADAVYFGLPQFNARLRAENFTREDLPEVMRFLHSHGVKGYVTLNVLVFTAELEQAAELLRWLESCGVDAAIVQDVGITRLARAVAPSLRLHASTQMSITSPEGVDFARSLGVSQVVLARELSLRELKKFSAAVPLEVFVHGALCVAYSGQCLTSEALGQRSANRGECAQACRMPYELVVDGNPVDLGDKRYLLSPQDLAAVDEIPMLMEAGVCSFKIEGRLKAPEYVAAVTAVYRRAIDRALNGGPAKAPEEDWYDLEMTFSRGLFPGWMHGVDHQQLVPARFGKKRGPFAGIVTHVGPRWIEIDAKIPLQPGDGVVIDQGGDPDKEQGGRLFGVVDGRLEFAHGKIDFRRIRIGDRVWKTDDPKLNRRLRETWASGRISLKKEKKLPLVFEVHGDIGMPLVLSARSSGRVAEVRSRMPLVEARKVPLTPERIRTALDRLEETPFRWEDLQWHLPPNAILPISEFSRMRRAVLEKLMQHRGEPAPHVSVQEIVARSVGDIDRLTPAALSKNSAALHVLCRTLDQARCAAGEGAETVYLDFEDIRRYAPAVKDLRREGCSQVFLATPRIQKAGEEGFFKLIERAEPDGVLVRNPGSVQYFKSIQLPMIGDFSLNVANPLSAAEFLDRGCERVTISYDLTVEQLLPLARCGLAHRLELTIHQHMPMFHMEHCVFAAFMSTGKDFTDCGRPCEKHRVHLRDRVGQEHPLRADVGCRNTLFRQAAQTGAAFFDELFQSGLRDFRVELLEESPDQAADVLSAYKKLFAGETSGAGLWEILRAQNQLGVTAGTLLAKSAL